MPTTDTLNAKVNRSFGTGNGDERNAVVIELCEGLPVEELHERLAFVHRLGESANRALAFYLCDMQERGVHVSTGDASAAEYAANKLGMMPRTARELIQVGKALLELDLIDKAFHILRLSF